MNERLSVSQPKKPRRATERVAGIPTMGEAGLPGVEVLNWQGLVGPMGLQRSDSKTKANPSFVEPQRKSWQVGQRGFAATSRAAESAGELPSSSCQPDAGASATGASKCWAWSLKLHTTSNVLPCQTRK